MLGDESALEMGDPNPRTIKTGRPGVNPYVRLAPVRDAPNQRRYDA